MDRNYLWKYWAEFRYVWTLLQKLVIRGHLVNQVALLYENLWQVLRKKCFLQNIASVSSLLDGQSALAQTAASTGILPTPPPSVPIQQSAPTTTTTPIPMDQDSVATQILNLLMAQTQQQQQQQQVQQVQPQQQQTLQPQGMLQWVIFCVCWYVVSAIAVVGRVFHWKWFSDVSLNLIFMWVHTDADIFLFLCSG